MAKEKRQVSWKTDRQGTPPVGTGRNLLELEKKKKIMTWKQIRSKARNGDCVVHNTPNFASPFFGGDGPFSAALVGQELAL